MSFLLIPNVFILNSFPLLLSYLEVGKAIEFVSDKTNQSLFPFFFFFLVPSSSPWRVSGVVRVGKREEERGSHLFAFLLLFL